LSRRRKELRGALGHGLFGLCVNPSLTMSILFLWRWYLVTVTYNVWNKTPECFSDYTGPVRYFRSARVYLLLLYMRKIQGKGKTCLHCR